MWPYLATLAVLGLFLLHWWWRTRYRDLERLHRKELDRLSHEKNALAEQAVLHQEAVFDGMTEGLLLVDKEGRVQLANRRFAEFFGLGDDLRGRTVIEASRSHELTELAESAARRPGQTSRILRLHGPEERHVEVSAAPIASRRGGREGLVIVLHDITRLTRLERTREEFVANVSHELRTPLSLIKGYVETLLDGAEVDPATGRKFLQTIHRNAQRLQALIEDLLAISSLESGYLQLDHRVVSLRDLVNASLEDYQSPAQARGIRIALELPDLHVRVDVERLYQVFGNLLDNAIKYGREQGSVSIRARMLPDHKVEVCVADDGPGIPSDSLGRIFERFYRVDKARSRDKGGTGLGLSIVKHIVQGHGGQAWAESELGKGTAVFFTLPQE